MVGSLVATIALLAAPWLATPAFATWYTEGTYHSYFDCQNVGQGGVNLGRWVAYQCERDYAGGPEDYILWVDIQAPTGDTVYIQGPGGKCIDVQWANPQNSQPVHLWQCTPNNAAQRWTIYSDGTIRAYGKCLDVRGDSTSNGAQIQIYDCNGGGNQKWESINLSGNTRMLRNPRSGRCIDAVNGGTADGTRIQLYTCVTTTSAQRWTFIAPIY